MSKIRAHLRASSEATLGLCEQEAYIEAIISLLLTTVSSGGTLFTCGNGGSSCDAMHFVEECVARYSKERPGIKAQHLIDAATITCWANDYNFEEIFERQVSTLASEKDLLIVFSTSGNSANILKALEAAKQKNCKTVALLGKNGGQAKALADVSLVVNSEKTAHIQEAHITLVHIFIEQLENRLFFQGTS